MTNRHGDFIWYELMTPDSAAAQAFYGPMLGWTFGGNDEYREIGGSEGGVGGMLQLTPEMTASGAHPGWVGYILVEDVDTMVASVEQDGGQTYMPARDMPGIGRFAMVADPQGAAFYVMKPIPPADNPDVTSNAFSYDKPRIGHCAWNELATSDPAAALAFYGQRFGWVKDGEMDMGPMGTYEFLRHAGRAPDGSVPGLGMLGAVYPKATEDPQLHWLYYFRVADIDAGVAHIEGNGGRLHQPPTEIPGGDYSLVGIDPQGAYFGLVGSRKG
jgi:uncharacterized protein